MTSTVWHLGARTDPDAAAAIVDAFRRVQPPVAGLVLPWDRPADVSTLDHPLAETTGGWLVGKGAECRWRVEGDRALVTVVADVELDLPGLVTADVEAVVVSAPIEWERPDRSPSVPVVEKRYVLTDGSLLVRLQVEEDHVGAG